MAEIIKAFSHAARDIFIYFLAGFTILFNLAYVDYFLNTGYGWTIIKIPYWAIIFSIIAYLLGHVVFAFMWLIFEGNCLRIEAKIKKCCFPIEKEKTNEEEKTNKEAFEVNYKKEMRLFTDKILLHDQFIERHTQLYLLRWNFSGALFACGCMNILALLCHSHPKVTLIYKALLIFYFFSSVVIYFLSLRTEKDCYDRNEAASVL